MRSEVRTAVIVLALVVLLTIAMPFWKWYGSGPLKAPIHFVVPQGATIANVGRKLEAAGAVRSSVWFRRLAMRLGSGDHIKAGEFVIPAGASPATILDLFQHGRPVLHILVIPEGAPAVVVANKLRAEPLLTGPVTIPAEGSVLPDGYSFARGETRAAVLARMQKAMTSTLASLWKQRKPTSIATSPQQAVILASLVEKETGVAAERRTIAGVYANRLQRHMLLQADPTVIYPITKGLPLGRRIRESELKADNGYNTYVRAGLPIGPITNPGRASIAAVLDPAPTQALYFVADGKGGHVFADTLAEHSANVQRWYAIRRARGEM
jgi:UPF0755 protein